MPGDSPVNSRLSYRRRSVDPLIDEYLAQLPALLVVGPRAAGKSTTLGRRARTIVRLDREADAAAFRADPDAALRGLAEPVLLDEWQNVPGSLGAVRRAVEADSRPGRFLVTGSVNASLENQVWPGTGRLTRVSMFPMSVREQVGDVGRGTFFDQVVGGGDLRVPTDSPDLRGYVEHALRSGFPHPALHLTGRARDGWLESYVADLLTHDIESARPSDGGRGRVNVPLLRRYFDAYVLNSAGIAADKTIYGAAGINRQTAIGYEALLEDLFVVERMRPWFSNRLQRLVQQPKRYVVDPALIGAALRIDAQGVMSDGDVLGRIIDSFVVAQLRSEVGASLVRPQMYHLRTKEGREEVDVVVEVSGRRIIGIEVKASAAPTERDARHLAWLRDQYGEAFVAGVVLHTGPQIFALGDRIIAAPISVLWG